MGKIQSLSDLDDAIKLLKFKKAEEENLLKELVYMTYENVKPINMIKNLFKDSVDPEDMKDSLLNTSVGYGVGYLTKILFQGLVRVPFKKFIGSALMLSVENLIAKNPMVVNTLTSFLLNTFGKKSATNVDKDEVHREIDNDPIDFETIY